MESEKGKMRQSKTTEGSATIPNHVDGSGNQQESRGISQESRNH